MQSLSGPGPSVAGVRVAGPVRPGYEAILTAEALAFLAELVRRHAGSIEYLLAARARRRQAWAAGQRLGWLAETAAVRASDWKVVEPAPDLTRRVVEITGPVDRKMIINALNSGADVFMADFEDSTTPSWGNMVEGQLHLRDAVRRTIRHDDPASGKRYELAEPTATLMARPRGLHLVERHCQVDGAPVPGSLFDFALYCFHNARALVERGSGPYFYLPKLESHLEARLWNAVFLDAEDALGLTRGTIRATVLIETLPAAFEMDEILYELREHSAGLNCGRWDYIFSFIKCRRHEPEAVLPDRSQVTMEQRCMRAYTRQVVRTCHRRGAHAMGGMAAQIPIKRDAEANRTALAKVRADKLREVGDGHDGTWVAHPGLVSVAREAFADRMDGPHQLDRNPGGADATVEDLLRVPEGTRTERGLRWNIRVGIRYLESWLRGTGCVPLYDLMEDAATAEISRAQIWQWRHHRAELADGGPVTAERVAQAIAAEMEEIAAEVGPEALRVGRHAEARRLFEQLCVSDSLEEFLTSRAYASLDAGPGVS
jgi:malate synthase